MEEVTVVKVLLVGDEKVGKSCILRRFTDDIFMENYISTIGVDFSIRQLKTTGTERIKKMQIWDTAGQERFRTITSSYYRGAHFVFIVYDVTQRDSFHNVKATWINEVKKFASETVKIALVGNKADLRDQRAVSTEEAAEWAALEDIQFIEVSTKDELDRGGVELLFQWAADAVEFAHKKLSPSLAEESAAWLKKILPFFDQFKYYQPIVKISAPRLEDSNVQQWIALNRQQLTQEVLTKMNHAVHLGTYERKGMTIQQAVYLFVLGGAIGCQKLSESAIQDLNLLAAKDADIRSVPKLIEDSSVIYFDQSLSSLISTLESLRDGDPKSRKATGMEALKFEHQWRDLIGRMYDERDSTGDVTVIVEDKPYKAHELVLVYNCDFFASCLRSSFREANRGEVRLDAEVTTAAWESLLTYFYKFDMSHITDTNVCMEIITCAPYLMLTSEAKSPVTHNSLLRHCDTTAYNSITDETALELLLAAYQNEDMVAKEIVFKYIVNNYFRLLDAYEGEFTKLPKPLMFSVLNRLIVDTAAKG